VLGGGSVLTIGKALAERCRILSARRYAVFEMSKHTLYFLRAQWLPVSSVVLERVSRDVDFVAASGQLSSPVY
jgi:hypothetical protein